MIRRLLLASPVLALFFIGYVLETEVISSQAPSPEAVARQHLEGTAGRQAGSGRPDLVHLSTRESPGAYHVRFQEELAGVPIFGAYVTVSVGKSRGEVGLVLDRGRPAATPASRSPVVGRSQAQGVALAVVGISQPRGNMDVRQVYFPVGRELVLAWQFKTPALEPLGDWLVVVRADTGVVVLTQNLLVYDSGQVFDPNPVVTGAPAPPPPPTDCDSAANETALSSGYRTRTLLGIDSGQNKLKGAFVDLTAPGIVGAYKAAGVAEEPSRDYVYGCDDDRFEEVMVYYHVDAAQRKIQSLGFSGASSIRNSPIPAHAHYMEECNAFYSPIDDGLHFGDCDASTDPPSGPDADTAEDADVVVHEYGHAIQANQVPGWGFGLPLAVEEAWAMGEGFGDFLSAARFGDPCVGEWVNFGETNCGGKPGLRSLQNTKAYPSDFEACRFPTAADPAEEHCAGEIWGGALWDLVEAFGNDQTARDLALRLVLDSHFYLDPQSTFAEAVCAIIQADADLYGGANAATIATVFNGRGITCVGPISDFPYAFLRIRHTWIGDLVVRLKAGPDSNAPLCNLLLVSRPGGGGDSSDDLAGFVNLTGSPCEPFLPPSTTTPWWLEAQDFFGPADIGTIADFQIALSGAQRCPATDIPVPIPDGAGSEVPGAVARSMVDCTNVSGSLPTSTSTGTPTPTPTNTPVLPTPTNTPVPPTPTPTNTPVPPTPTPTNTPVPPTPTSTPDPGLDSDGDGYTDVAEEAIGGDPNVHCAIMRADVDHDGAVSILDLSAVAGWFLSAIPPAPARYDQNGNGNIEILDLAVMGGVFLQNVGACP